MRLKGRRCLFHVYVHFLAEIKILDADFKVSYRIVLQGVIIRVCDFYSTNLQMFSADMNLNYSTYSHLNVFGDGIVLFLFWLYLCLFLKGLKP